MAFELPAGASPKTGDLFQVAEHRRSEPPVFRLNALCRPTAIGRGIVPIFVDAVNRMLPRRPPAHIGDEICNAHPASANSDAAASVRRKRFITGVETPTPHVSPCDVLRSQAVASRFAMTKRRYGCHSRLEASAAFSLSSLEMRRSHSAASAALAKTSPTRGFILCVRAAKNGQTTEAKPEQVFEEHEPWR